MKRVAVVGFDTGSVITELKILGFVIDKMRPDIVVSFGGDGSALVGEQLYPGIPRLMIRHSRVCEKCSISDGHDLSAIFEKLKNGEYEIKKAVKLDGELNGNRKTTLTAMNEINVAHALPIRALRFDVNIDGRSVKNLIGDGVITSTPYGSSGYYYSVTGRTFTKGIGIAYNNTKDMNTGKLVSYMHSYSPEPEVAVSIARGPGVMCADNNSNMIPLKDGDIVTIKQSKEIARIIQLSGKESKLSL